MCQDSGHSHNLIMSMTTESRLRRHHIPASTIHGVGLIIFTEMRDRRQRGQGRYLHWHSDESCLVWVVKLSQHTLLIDSLHSLSVCFLSHIQIYIYNTYFGLQLAVDILYWHVTLSHHVRAVTLTLTIMMSDTRCQPGPGHPSSYLEFDWKIITFPRASHQEVSAE